MDVPHPAFYLTLFHGPWPHHEQLATVRVVEDSGYWYAHTCTITRRPVSADPDAVLSLLIAARKQIEHGEEPDFGQMLYDFTGLRLPILGYR